MGKAAYDQAKKVFLKWFDSRGGNTRSDEEKAFRQVAAFFETNESRFQNLEFPETPPPYRAGYIQREKSGDDLQKTFYILPEVFRREVTKGFDHKFVAKMLVERGYLKSNVAGIKYFSGIGSHRVYEMKDVLAEAEKTKTANM